MLYEVITNFFRITLAVFWLVAFSSATHDIAADGFYMLALNVKDQALYVGIVITSYSIHYTKLYDENGDRKSLQIAHDLLSQLKIRYYIIPGNHETKWSESGVTAFSQLFGSERFTFEHKGFLFLGFNSGPLMRMADGHVAPQDITWLKRNNFV